VYRGRQSPRRSRPGYGLSLCVAQGYVGAHDPGDVVGGELLACWPCSSSPSGPSTSRPSASALDLAEPTDVGVRLDVPELYRAVVIRRPSHSVVRPRWGTGNDRLCRREQSPGQQRRDESGGGFSGGSSTPKVGPCCRRPEERSGVPAPPGSTITYWTSSLCRSLAV